MKDWFLLLGTFTEGLIVAGAAALAGGLGPCLLACLVGGWCIAQRDHNYQRSRT